MLPALSMGGLWRHVTNLQRCRLDGVEVDVVVLFDHPEATGESLPPGVSGLHLHFAPTQWARRSMLTSATAEAIRFLKARVVHTMHVYSDIYALPAAASLGLPAIRSVHGITQVSQTDRFRKTQVLLDWGKEEIQAELDVESLCAETIVVSHDLRRRLITYGFSSHKVSVLHNGVAVDYFCPAFGSEARLLARRAIGCDDETLVIGFVGRLDAVKDPVAFLDLACHFERRNNIRFVMIGSGPMESKLRTLIEERRVSRHIAMMGSRSDIRDGYAMMDILIQTSRTEGCSCVLLEAMAQGIPVVASSVGGTPELIRDGVNGFLFPGDDLLACAARVGALIDDPELRRTVGDRARRTAVTDFDLTTHNTTLVDIYRRVALE